MLSLTDAVFLRRAVRLYVSREGVKTIKGSVLYLRIIYCLSFSVPKNHLGMDSGVLPACVY